MWKGARRASAMIALGMTAASSYITETMPSGKPTDQVSLLEFLSIIDHATTFHLVAELTGHSGDDFCRQFTHVWGNVFGAPGTISADLESGLQVGVSKYAEFHGCRLRSSAGQAHWQQGVIERRGLWYQEILQRVIDEKSCNHLG